MTPRSCCSRLELAPAHVIGASMGGMIAQTLAARHPEQVRSLVSIMSNTGNRFSGQPSPRVYATLLRRAPRERAAFVAHMEGVFAAIGSRGLPRDAEEIRALAGLELRPRPRRRRPRAPARRDHRLRRPHRASCARIRTPTLVVHGTADPLVAPSGGRATARAIPGARLMSIEKMGHDLPRVIWPQLIDAIAAHTARADELTERFSIPADPPGFAPGSAGIDPLSSPPSPSGSTDAGCRRAGRPASGCERSGTSRAAAARARASEGRAGSVSGDTASGHAFPAASAARGKRRPSSPLVLRPFLYARPRLIRCMEAIALLGHINHVLRRMST